MDTSPDLPTRRPRVMVLFGGRSGEHAISCATAGGVLRAVDRERYDVLAVGITPAGVSKGSAVRTVAEQYGIHLNDVMYVGDAENDLSALQIVGHPVAMNSSAVIS